MRRWHGRENRSRELSHLARAEKLLPQYGTPETRLLCVQVRMLLAAVLGQTEELGRVMAGPVRR